MKSKKQKLFWPWVIVAVLLWLSLPACTAEKNPAHTKVAVVNGSVITQDEFDREMGRVRQQIAGAGRAVDDTQLATIKKDLLERLINRELLFQETQKRGIRVQEQVVSQQMKAIRDRFPSDDEYKKALKGMDLSEPQVRSQIVKGLAIQEFVSKQFEEKATISAEESRDYYAKNPDAFKQPEQVRASHILIMVDPKADQAKKDEAREKMAQIQQRLKKGDDFAALAKDLSECPSSEKGGDLGYFGRGQMVKPFEDKAFAMKPGEVSDIVETDVGYHLIKVAEKKPETTVAYEEIKGRLDEYLRKTKVDDQLTQYVDALKGKARVERFLMEK